MIRKRRQYRRRTFSDGITGGYENKQTNLPKQNNRGAAKQAANDPKTVVNKNITPQQMEQLKRNYDSSKVRDFARTAGTAVLGAYLNQKVGAPKNNGLAGIGNGENPQKPIEVKHTIITKDGATPVQGDHYRTDVTLGKSKLSKAWSILKTLHGHQTIVHQDTLFDVTLDSTKKARTEIKTGFNEKGFWLDENFYWDRSDVAVAIPGLQTWLEPNTTAIYNTKNKGTILAYMGWMKNSTEIKFENINNYFPAKVKIHLCCLKDAKTLFLSQEATQPGAEQSTVHIPISNVQQLIHRRVLPDWGTNEDNETASAVPAGYKAADTPRTADNFKVKINYNKDTFLTKSTFFKENIHVVRTHTKILKPADTWTYKYNVLHSSGIKLNTWIDQARDGDTTNLTAQFPVDYFPIIELVGQDCEALSTPVSSNGARTIGTSPVGLTYESKKTCMFINSDVEDVNPSDNKGTNNLDGTNIALRRILTNATKGGSPTDATQLMRTFSYSKVVTDPEAAGGNIVIPLTTNLEDKYV